MKKIFVVLLFLISLFPAFSQVSVDPGNDFYSDAVNWYLKGYIEKLPQLKPYPVNVIKNILLQVMEKGEQKEKARAEFYYNDYIEKDWSLILDSSGIARVFSIENKNEKTDGWDTSYFLSGELSFSGDKSFNDYSGAGYSVGLRGLNNNIPVSDVLPLYVSNSSCKTIKPFEFDCGKINLLLDLNGNVTFGTKTLYGSVGYNRVAYGPFADSDLILDAGSNQMLNGTFNYEGKYFQYSQLFGGITAQNLEDKDDYQFNKFINFHSLNIPFRQNKVNFAYFESVVYGNEFMPAYLMPVPWVVIANVAGSRENILSGFKLEYKPVSCIAMNAELLLDDLQITPLIKLKLDEAAVRAAFKTGFQYAPLNSICSLITCDFMFVTPYCYTKYDANEKSYNYMDYTNFGKGIGTDLLPNSERVCLSLDFKPTKTLEIKTTTSYVRHANQYESLSEEDVMKLTGKTATDGTIRQDTRGLDSAKDSTDFINQDDVMYMMQSSLDFTCKLSNRTLDEVFLSFGYTFEYIMNDGVDKSIYPGTYSSEEEVQAARTVWKAQLHNSYNHYFRVGVKISY